MLTSTSPTQSHTLDLYINKEIANIDTKEITKQIEKIEQSIDQKSFYKENFSQLDERIMPFLVNMANRKKEGLKLSYKNTPEDFLEKVKNKENQNNTYIVRIGDNAAHCAVIDVKTINGKPSILLFEPANIDSDSSGLLAFRIKFELASINISNQFCVIELDIQKSHYDCAIFNLAIAKKIHKHEDAIRSLHKFIVDNEISNPQFEGCIKKNITDKFLPADFYKHTQGKNRIQEYLTTNPENTNHILNKKNENIIDIMNSRFIEVNEDGNTKSISKSIHVKRLTELKNLRDLVQNEISHPIDPNSEKTAVGSS